MQTIRDRSLTGHRPIVTLSRAIICRNFYSLMGRRAFPGQKKMLADASHCTLQFSGLQRPYPGSPRSWPRRYVFKGLSSALRTSAINGNRLKTSRRIRADLKFLGNSEVWSPVVASGCQRSPLFLGCRRLVTGLYLCATVVLRLDNVFPFNVLNSGTQLKFIWQAVPVVYNLFVFLKKHSWKTYIYIIILYWYIIFYML